MIFFTFFLTILPVRVFVRPRQKVSRGHFVSILCSTALCALNHGLNFVGNSAYTFQRERLTNNLRNIFSFFQKKCKKLFLNWFLTSRIAGRSTDVYGTRRTYEKSTKIVKNRNVTLILLIVLIVQVNVLNCDNPPPGGYPHPLGSGWNVSNNLKSDFFIFFLSMKVQRKNVLKRE